MKDLILNKRVLAACLAACFLLGLTGITFAYYQDVTDKAVNTFTVGNVTTEIEEKFEVIDSEIIKEPIVVNTGKNSCYIRMRVIISPSDAANITGLDETNWELYTDGYYYYKKHVEPKEKTSPVFKGVSVTEGFSGEVEIACYQESVQAEATVEGEAVTDMMEIWDAYDNRKAVFK